MMKKKWKCKKVYNLKLMINSKDKKTFTKITLKTPFNAIFLNIQYKPGRIKKMN